MQQRYARNQGEALEQRHCLSAIGFAEHDIEAWLSVAATADIDNDGDLDLVGSRDGELHWRENTDGRGTFGNITSIGQAKLVTTGDFDGDGDLDVLGSINRNEFMWFENLRTGEYGLPKPIAVDLTSYKIAAEDLDGDGDAEIVRASFREIEVLQRNAAGDFEVIHSITSGARDFSVVDFDGDGVKDILFVANGSVRWLQRQEGNLFATVDTTIPNHGTVLVEDLDANGLLDVVTVSDFGLVRYEARPNSFDFERVHDGTEFLGGHIAHMWSGDFDGDGDLDIVSQCYADGGEPFIAWYEVASTGQLMWRSVLSEPYLGGAPVADLDGDGIDEIIFPEYRLVLPKATHDSETEIAFDHRAGVTGSISDLELADLDADGDLDILTISHGGGPCRVFDFAGCWSTLTWSENLDGRGSFGPRMIIQRQASAPNEGRLIAQDVDGDGDLDLIHNAFTYMGLVFHENQGSGRFSLAKETVIEFEPPRHDPNIDIDLDGDFDLFDSNEFKISERWWENVNGQSIARSARVDGDFQFGDVDGDGDLDYVTGRGGLFWYENRRTGDANGDGVFDSSDLVQVMLEGKYEEETFGRATFDEGDWNGDGVFNSSDLVYALEAGTYDAPLASKRDVAAAVEFIFGQNKKEARTEP